MRRVGREVRQRRPDEAADVDAVVHVELVVLDGEERVDHVLGHLGELDRLAVLQLERGDLVAGHVVDVRALGERREVGQLDRELVVGVGDPPQPGRDGDDDRRDQQRAGDDHERQSEHPAEPVTVRPTLPTGRRLVAPDRGHSDGAVAAPSTVRTMPTS